jgi:hypothetical protein
MFKNDNDIRWHVQDVQQHNQEAGCPAATATGDAGQEAAHATA